MVTSVNGVAYIAAPAAGVALYAIGLPLAYVGALMEGSNMGRPGLPGLVDALRHPVDLVECRLRIASGFPPPRHRTFETEPDSGQRCAQLMGGE